jgi:hypothetical protein
MQLLNALAAISGWIAFCVMVFVVIAIAIGAHWPELRGYPGYGKRPARELEGDGSEQGGRAGNELKHTRPCLSPKGREASNS